MISPMQTQSNNDSNLWFYNYFAPYMRRDNRLPLKGEAKISVDFNQELMVLKIEGKLKGLFFHIAHETGDGNKTAFGYALKMMGKFNGIADYVFIHDTKTVFLEVKSGKNKASDHQKLFQQWCELEHIPYAIMTSAEEGITFLKQHAFIESK